MTSIIVKFMNLGNGYRRLSYIFLCDMCRYSCGATVLDKVVNCMHVMMIMSS